MVTILECAALVLIGMTHILSMINAEGACRCAYVSMRIGSSYSHNLYILCRSPHSSSPCEDLKTLANCQGNMQKKIQCAFKAGVSCAHSGKAGCCWYVEIKNTNAQAHKIVGSIHQEIIESCQGICSLMSVGLMIPSLHLKKIAIAMIMIHPQAYRVENDNCTSQYTSYPSCNPGIE